MNTTTLKFAAPALMLAALLSSAGCKSTKDEGKGSTEVVETPRGKSEISTHTTTATITGIDAPSRRVTLTTPDGRTSTYTLGPEVRNFDQLRIGDQVKTTLTEEVAVSVQKGGTPTSGEGTVVSRAPVGGQPGGVIANTRQVTGKIIAIDGRDVTLRFADGTTRKIKAGKDVDLAGISPGDTVTARFTEAMAITVEKP
jgi:hypothetical protein